MVLASASPRRLGLLRNIGVHPEVRPADIDETPRAGEGPAAYVQRLAAAKAAAVARDGEVVIAADTTVSIDGHIIGKPADRAEAIDTLRALSGRTHTVYTGLAVLSPAGLAVATVTSEVTFIRADESLLAWYADTDEPYDKAGGYGLQGAGSMLVAGVRGSVSNVVGLPLAQLHELMASPARDAGAARRPHELEGGHAGGPKSPGGTAKSPFALRSTVPSQGGQKTSSVMADTAAEYVSRA